jgi:phenylpropionate dioxygenase-like ring-hydroxylating dioxygenase large terminal subunit
MLKSADGGLRPVPFPVEDPERIPSQRYYDPELYAMEVEHLWPHVWQMAARLEQIAEEGDWVEYQNLGKSVIVVNTGAGGIKAYHNACRHRGVPNAGTPKSTDAHIAKGGHRNCRPSGDVCPFHGWRFDMHGENTFVYGRQLFSQRQLEAADLNLIPCRVETALGCAFINFDDDAPSFRETIGPLGGILDQWDVGKLRMEWWVGTVLPANWKLAMEAFMEGYHVMKTHPQLQQVSPALFNTLYGSESGDPEWRDRLKMTSRDAIHSIYEQYRTTSEGMGLVIQGRQIEIARSLLEMDLPDDPDQAIMHYIGTLNAEITRQLREDGEPAPDLNLLMQTAPLRGVEFVFPHYFLLPMLAGFSSYRVRPLGPESCFFELYSLVYHREGEEYEPVMECTVLSYDSLEFPPIPRQDYSNIPIQQVGMHAKGFEFMRLSKNVEGMVSNYQRIIDGYLKGLPQDKLARATHLLTNNFDDRIEDLGF